LLLASMGAAVLLGALVASASARNFEVSNQRLRASFTNFEIHAPGVTTRCALTIEASLQSRTMAKVAGSLIGYITRADLGACTASTATILTTTLPWHARYSGFSGTLPEISSIITHVIGFSFRFRGPGDIACLARSTTAEPLIVNYHRNTATRVLEAADIRGTMRTEAECLGISLSFRTDMGPLVGSPNGERVSVSLI